MERQSFSRGEQSLRALSVVASGYGVRVCSSPGPTHCDGKGVMVYDKKMHGNFSKQTRTFE